VETAAMAQLEAAGQCAARTAMTIALLRVPWSTSTAERSQKSALDRGKTKSFFAASACFGVRNLPCSV
jgi:hypothetical protein